MRKNPIIFILMMLIMLIVVGTPTKTMAATCPYCSGGSFAWRAYDASVHRFYCTSGKSSCRNYYADSQAHVGSPCSVCGYGTVSKVNVNAPSNVQVSTDGIVTWTASSNATGYQISIDNATWETATSGIDYLSKIIAATGTRTVYVRAVNSNTSSYNSPSSNATKAVTVYTVTIGNDPANGGTVTTESYNVISGATYESSGNKLIIKGGSTTLQEITATANAGYKFSSWSSTSGTISAATTINAKYTELVYKLMQRESSTYISGTGYIYYAIGASRSGNTKYTADLIKTITFVNSNVVPTDGSVEASWDASYTSGDYAVMAWVKPNEVSGDYYDLYIGGNGKIVAPAQSYRLFEKYTNCETIKNISVLDTSSVTNMSYMFYTCSSLTNLDLSSFNTSSVTSMSSMFSSCRGLTSLDVSSFDTSKVTSMFSMFSNCSSLTSLDVSSFKTSSVTDMIQMFMYCSSLTSLDVSGFNTGSVTSMSSMFSSCSSLTSLDVSSFDTSKVTNMYRVFSGCSSLTSLDVSSFNTSSVTNMGAMFSSCSGLTSIDVSSFNTSSVTNMGAMFSSCSGLTSIDVSSFNTSSVTSMSSMFSSCRGLTSLDVNNFNTSGVTNMSYMFYNCSSLTSIDVSGFNTSSVTDMEYMFGESSSLTSIDVSSFNTSSVTNMKYMFKNCSSLTGLDVSSFDTSSVTGMYNMFSSCSSLTSLDLSSFNTSSVTDMRTMFSSCSKLELIILGPKFNKLISSSMFAGSTKLKAIITQTNPTLVNTKGLEVGDYIAYTPQASTYKTDSSKTGYTSQELKTDETVNWRVLSIDEEKGTAKITTDRTVNDGTFLSGTSGFLYGPDELDTICENLYSNTDLKLVARSMIVEDIDEATGYNKTSYSDYGTKYAYYKSADYVSGTTNGYTNTKHTTSSSNGFSEPRFYESDAGGANQTETNGNAYVVPTATSPVQVTYTYYEYDTSTINPIVGEILEGYGFLASRCVLTASNFAGFIVRGVSNGIVHANDMVHSYGLLNTQDRGLRPVLTINIADLNLSDTTKDGSTKDTAWEIEENSNSSILEIALDTDLEKESFKDTILYVHNEDIEKAYEGLADFETVFGPKDAIGDIARIKPILEVSGDNPVLVARNSEYDKEQDAGALVAGLDISNSGDSFFGYSIETSGLPVDTKETDSSGEVIYMLYYKDPTPPSGETATKKELMTATRTVKVNVIPNYSVDGKYYPTLEEAYKEAILGDGVIKVEAEVVEDDSTFTVEVGKTITLDTNGKTIIKKSSTMINEGTLEITGDGTISTTSIGILNNGIGTINVSNVTIDVASASEYDIFGIKNETTGTVNIYEGANIVVNNTGTGDAIGVYNNTSGTIEITGGTIEAKGNNENYIYGVVNHEGELNISGNANVKVINNGSGQGRGVYTTTGTVNITGGTIDAKTYGIINNSAKVNISGNSTSITARNGVMNSTTSTSESVITITGGTINANIYGLYNRGSGKIIIGTNDENVSKDVPIIVSKQSAYYKENATSTIEFYDGILKSKEAVFAGGEGVVVKPIIPEGYGIFKDTETIGDTPYNTARLEIGWDISADDGVSDVWAFLVEDPENAGKYVLTIRGTGAMKNFADYPEVPWHDNRENILDLVIEEGVTTIGNRAFARLRITSIALPSTISYIGMYSFNGCSKVTNPITIPKNVISIGSNPFLSVPTTAINVENGNTAYKSVDGVLYTIDGKTLVAYPYGKTDLSYTVLDGTEVIDGYACYGMKGTNVELPSTLTEIGGNAFAISNLTSIIIPSSVKEIDGTYYSKSNSYGGAFTDCKDLKTVYIESQTLDKLDSGAFVGIAEDSTIYTASKTVADMFEGEPLKYTKETTKIYYPPKITAQPQNVTVTYPNTATFTVVAEAGNPTDVKYKWQVSTDGGTTWEDISGAPSSASYTTPATTVSMSGNKYRCIISSSEYPNTVITESEIANFLVSDVATITVEKATPTITLNKGSVAINEGASDTITIEYNGDGEISATSSDVNIVDATLSSNTITVKGISAGTATITVTATAGSNFAEPENQTINVIVYGAPTVPVIKVLNEENVEIESGEWSSSDLTISLQGSTLVGVGNIVYQYSFDELTWTEFTDDFEFDTETNETKLYVRAYNSDAPDMKSDVKEFIIRLDKTIPTISINENNTVKYVTKDDTIELMINVEDKGSGVDTSTFKSEDINVYIAGELANVEKSLVYESSSNGIYTFKLTIKNAEKVGWIQVEIPKESLSDNINNQNDTTILLDEDINVFVDNNIPEINLDGEMKVTSITSGMNISGIIDERYINKEYEIEIPLVIVKEGTPLKTDEFKASDIIINIGDKQVVPTEKRLEVVDTIEVEDTDTKIVTHTYKYILILKGLKEDGYLSLKVPANAVNDIMDKGNEEKPLEVYTKVEDGAGGEKECKVFVDNTKPRVIITEITNMGSVNKDSVVEIPITVLDNGAGIRKDEFKVNDFSIQVNGVTVTNATVKLDELSNNYESDLGGEYKYILTISNLTDNGILRIQVLAEKITDKANNTNDAVTIPLELKVDNKGPNIGNIIVNTDEYGNLIGNQTELEINDCTDDSGIASYKWEVSTDGINWKTIKIDNTMLTTSSAEHQLEDDGEYYYRVIVSDTLGNSTTSKVVTVNFNKFLNRKPTIRFEQKQIDSETVEITALIKSTMKIEKITVNRSEIDKTEYDNEKIENNERTITLKYIARVNGTYIFTVTDANSNVVEERVNVSTISLEEATIHATTYNATITSKAKIVFEATEAVRIVNPDSYLSDGITFDNTEFSTKIVATIENGSVFNTNREFTFENRSYRTTKVEVEGPIITKIIYMRMANKITTAVDVTMKEAYAMAKDIFTAKVSSNGKIKPYYGIATTKVTTRLTTTSEIEAAKTLGKANEIRSMTASGAIQTTPHVPNMSVTSDTEYTNGNVTGIYQITNGVLEYILGSELTDAIYRTFRVTILQ